MSFQKRTRQLPIAGTKPSLHNGQLLTSTGNPSLDYILGGGQQLNTLLLIEEDKSGCYASTLTKYYLAEGVLQKHSLFVAALDDDPQAIIEKLPAPVVDAENASKPPMSTNPDDDMRIAWRYNNLPKVDSVEESKKSNFEHFFDLSKTLEEEIVRQVEITTWNGTKSAPSSYIKNPQMQDCLRKLHETAQKYPLEKSSKLLRVVIQSFASPYWYTSSFVPDLIKFLYTLKSILRHTTATCLITIPSHLLKHVDSDLVTKIRSSVDYAIELESFAGSERETNPIFKDYHGLLNIKRIQAVNSPAAYQPKIKDLAFKLRRKKFVIEKLHLPPELQESAEREQDDIVPGGVGCSSAKGKKLLDF
ncbi:elongator complex protein 4 [Culicoides brevitarsis]|uniref:elongator complex protein 4 n=1 Tax=Culicoides brevitarsis TaxID=469753 RepID=UPI00307C4A5C